MCSTTPANKSLIINYSGANYSANNKQSNESGKRIRSVNKSDINY